MIGICTDSNSQLPDRLAAQLGIEVVPLSVTVDGVDHLEGVDLDAAGFYRMFDDHTPSVATAAPGPGRFLEAYARLAARGATEIVSVHVGAALSGTFNAARLAAQETELPVLAVDTGAASYVVAAAAIEAAGAAGRGAAAADVVAVAERTAASCGNVFFVGGLEFLRAGGRADPALGSERPGVPILSLLSGQVTQIATALDLREAVAVMVGAVLASGPAVHAAVGTSDPSTFAIGDLIAEGLRTHGVEAVRYRVGPSVGAHTGPGTAGVVFYPGP